MILSVGGVDKVRLGAAGNMKIGGAGATRATTEGTAHLDLFNGTAPAGTLTNGVSVYSTGGEVAFMNANGDAFIVKAPTANGTVATAMSSLGPTGSNTTIQEWLTITVKGTIRYIPCF